ncbi:MAG: TlpA family protein disulfide reductase [Alphaproteobacteria bacterium]
MFKSTQMFAALVFGFILSSVASLSVADDTSDFLVGDFAKKFDLVDEGKAVDLSQIVNADGELVDLATLNGRVVLVNFWATWCVPCRHEMPTLNKAAELWGDEGLTVLTVSVDRTAKQALAYLQKNKFDALTFGYDARMDVFSSMDGLGLPFTLLVDRDGNKVGHLSGPADWSSDEAAVLMKHLL